MNGKDFSEVVRLILKEDGRYDRGAYFFLREALDFTVKRQQKGERARRSRHVDGKTLCCGIRDFALEQYGPMAETLLRTWGLTKTGDFGDLVYNLVDYSVFGVQEGDRREDFDDVFDFHEAFAQPYLPERTDRFPRLGTGTPTTPR